jgi:hypothetical protein
MNQTAGNGEKSKSVILKNIHSVFPSPCFWSVCEMVVSRVCKYRCCVEAVVKVGVRVQQNGVTFELNLNDD